MRTALEIVCCVYSMGDVVMRRSDRLERKLRLETRRESLGGKSTMYIGEVKICEEKRP